HEFGVAHFNESVFSPPSPAVVSRLPPRIFPGWVCHLSCYVRHFFLGERIDSPRKCPTWRGKAPARDSFDAVRFIRPSAAVQVRCGKERRISECFSNRGGHPNGTTRRVVEQGGS